MIDLRNEQVREYAKWTSEQFGMQTSIEPKWWMTKCAMSHGQRNRLDMTVCVFFFFSFLSLIPRKWGRKTKWNRINSYKLIVFTAENFETHTIPVTDTQTHAHTHSLNRDSTKSKQERRRRKKNRNKISIKFQKRTLFSPILCELKKRLMFVIGLLFATNSHNFCARFLLN